MAEQEPRGAGHAPRVIPYDERPVVPVSVVRRWATQVGLQVGTRGHIPKSVIEAFNAKHRKSKAVNNNPWAGRKEEEERGG